MLALAQLAGAEAGRPPGATLPARTIGPDDYQSFVANWDEAAQPVRCARIRTPAQWRAVFQPAAFGFGTSEQSKPFAPDPPVFDREELLVVARAVPAAADSEVQNVFRVESVDVAGGTVTLAYRYAPPAGPASFTAKTHLGVFIPKGDYRRVIFVENGRTVADLAEAEAAPSDRHPVPVPERLQAYCIDFNWGPGGPNAFAKPGLWADADPAAHVAWYRGIGCNVIQTFAVSCNGYAWYKNGVVPAQPGLQHDFLPEVVRLAHRENLLVFGYFCAGANTRWGQTRPEQSYGIPSTPHIPYTDAYLAYLDGAVRDAIAKSGMDGFMVDWLRMPANRRNDGQGWLEAEKQLYVQLMNEPFPGEGQVAPASYTEYGRRALERCWRTIRAAARETDPACLVWLTSHDIHDPHLRNGHPLRDADWLLNEAGDIPRTQAARAMIGPHTRLLTCLAAWNKQDPAVIIPDAVKAGIGLYGFTKPTEGNLKPPAGGYLAQPVASFTNADDRHIAALARAFLGLPPQYVRTGDAR